VALFTTIAAALSQRTWQWIPIVHHFPRAWAGPESAQVSLHPQQAFEQHLRCPRLGWHSGNFDIQQPRSVAAENRPALGFVESDRTFDKPDRIDLAHVGG
jgi:hypothetical protein